MVDVCSSISSSYAIHSVLILYVGAVINTGALLTLKPKIKECFQVQLKQDQVEYSVANIEQA